MNGATYCEIWGVLKVGKKKSSIAAAYGRIDLIFLRSTGGMQRVYLKLGDSLKISDIDPTDLSCDEDDGDSIIAVSNAESILETAVDLLVDNAWEGFFDESLDVMIHEVRLVE